MLTLLQAVEPAKLLIAAFKMRNVHGRKKLQRLTLTSYA